MATRQPLDDECTTTAGNPGGLPAGASAEQEEGWGKHCRVGGHFPAKASVGGGMPSALEPEARTLDLLNSNALMLSSAPVLPGPRSPWPGCPGQSHPVS